MNKETFNNPITEFPSLLEDDERAEFTNLELKDLLDDECEQIVMSDELFSAFRNCSKSTKHFNAPIIDKFFKHVVCLYNESLQDGETLGALEYMQGIVNLMDYIEMPNIMELSINQLALLMSQSENSILSTYNKIQGERYNLSFKDFDLYQQMVLDSYNGTIDIAELEKEFSYIVTLYNENSILQDNVDYLTYLGTFSTFDGNVFALRMVDIIDLFGIKSINFDNVNEEKKLLNDLALFTVGQ